MASAPAGPARLVVFGVDLGEPSVIPIVVGYCLTSSLLAVVNKAAITVFPFATLLTALQYTVSAISVFVLGRFNFLQHDALSFDKVLAYSPAALVFYLAIFTNMTLLQYANLETFIVFRSSTPLIVAVADTVFRNQPLPSKVTFASLGAILLGAVGYMLTDSQFSVTAYSWAVAYLAVITFEMVYVKHIVTNLGLNTWGFVYYNNIMSLALSPLFWLISGEFRRTNDAQIMDYLDFYTIFIVTLSCVFGLAISFFGFATRTAVSATSFTVLGVTNKLLTIIVNVCIWDKHASPLGIFFLVGTIAGGVWYQQSMVADKAARPKEVALVDESQGDLESSGLLLDHEPEEQEVEDRGTSEEKERKTEVLNQGTSTAAPGLAQPDPPSELSPAEITSK
eukprot:TRINITY_DN4004_c1_g2_i1.p1 TRINITY_DN4004_c1_g2~~TRINITY_DN4004_c1_g2_i1.p1  ORF type:complete len:394 (+),score=38.30 TRINITY_DN4004_c1_g2_i1:305-1486(+)